MNTLQEFFKVCSRRSLKSGNVIIVSTLTLRVLFRNLLLSRSYCDKDTNVPGWDLSDTVMYLFHGNLIVKR